MIPLLSRFRRLSNVLGMNRRNAEYIMRWNPRASFPLVDDKIITKQLAKKHEIPTPPVFNIIEHPVRTADMRGILEEHREFVVKPARGAGGSGIIVVTERKGESFVKSSGAGLTLDDLVHHISDILSGIHSLSGLPDRAIIEGLIHPDATFEAVSYRGVPDIRIIVFRGVPVMAMVRLPTRSSDGKANLHRGAIGVGIDIATGTTLFGVHRSRIITHHPDTRKAVNGIVIPKWNAMLMIAARSFEMTGMGYLGVDLVIDEVLGPLLLELNARPGLAIQLANQEGLLARLQYVDQAPNKIFSEPQRRIEFALSAFARKSTRKAS